MALLIIACVAPSNPPPSIDETSPSAPEIRTRAVELRTRDPGRQQHST